MSTLHSILLFGLKFSISVILIFLVYYVFLFVVKYRVTKFSFQVNGRWLPLMPFVGNVYVALMTKGRVNMISTLIWAEKRLGMPVNFWFGYKYHYMSKSATEARIVLNHPKCINKAELYLDVKTIFSSSLLLVDGEEWKPRRRFLRAAYKTNMLQSFVPVFFRQSCNLKDEIEKIRPNECLFKFFNRYAFANFFLTSSGLTSEDMTSGIEMVGELLDRTQDEFVKLLINPLIPAEVWMNIPPGWKLKKCLSELECRLKDILLDKQRKKMQSQEYIEDRNSAPLIELLLSDAYQNAKNYDVFKEFVLFAGAATDTTGHTLAFCFSILGMYNDIQERLYEEVVSVVGDTDFEYSHLKDLKYTEMVINETLRVLPTIPLFGRYCDDDIDIGNGTILPKGANFFISAFHIHRNPEYWPDPEKFDPERFSEENFPNIIPGSYLPFSAGPRNCIGQGVAMILMKITVATVVKNFRITSAHKSIKEFRLNSCISMKTEDPLDCKFISR